MKIVFTIVQQSIHRVVRLVMIPFEEADSPWAAMVVVSLLLALLALLAFKMCSRQKRLVAARDRMVARTLELYVFRHDVAAIGGIFLRILKEMSLYLTETFRPVLIAIIPMVLLIGHVSPWLGFTPASTGKPSQLTVSLADAIQDVQAEPVLPDGVFVDGDVFRSFIEKELVWNLRSEKEAAGVIQGANFSKSFVAGDAFYPVYPKSSVRWIDLVMYPGDPLLQSGSNIVSVAVDYPERQWSLAGFNMNWLVLLFLLSIAWGIVLKKPFGVEF